jgi:hypothetical protein
MKYLNFFYCLVLLSLMPSNTYSCSWETFKFACESCFCCDWCYDSSYAENIKIRRLEERARIASEQRRAEFIARARIPAARNAVPAAPANTPETGAIETDSLAVAPALSARSSLASRNSADDTPIVPVNSPIALDIMSAYLNGELVHYQHRQENPMRSPDSFPLRSPNSLPLRPLDSLALRSNSVSGEVNEYLRRTSRTVDGSIGQIPELNSEMLDSANVHAAHLHSDHQEYSESGIVEMRSRPSLQPLPHAVADDNLQG